MGLCRHALKEIGVGSGFRPVGGGGFRVVTFCRVLGQTSEMGGATAAMMVRRSRFLGEESWRVVLERPGLLDKELSDRTGLADGGGDSVLGQQWQGLGCYGLEVLHVVGDDEHEAVEVAVIDGGGEAAGEGFVGPDQFS